MKKVAKIDYVELPATDMAATKEFYGAAFGWTFEDWGEEYTAITNAGLDGGFRKTDTPPPRDCTLLILYADDLDLAETAVSDAGGKVISHHEFPGGKRFQFLDPSRNELAVWKKD
jgi:predicted enzyme related to lactoylglutathione lyase